MRLDGWVISGLLGAAISVLCCFTPLAVVALGAVGLAGYAGWIDPIALPVLALSIAILILSAIRSKRLRA